MITNWKNVEIDKTTLKKYKDVFYIGEKPIFTQSSKKDKTYILKKLIAQDYNINFNETKWTSQKTKKILFNESSFYSLNLKRIETNGMIEGETKATIIRKFEEINSQPTTKFELEENNYEQTEEELEKEGDIYIIKNNYNITHINTILYKTSGFCTLKYKFENPHDATSLIIDTNINSVQQFQLIINNKINEFVDYAKLHYRCPKCEHEFYKNKNIVECNEHVKCEAINAEGKMCGGLCKKPSQLSHKITYYTYECEYKENGQNKHIIAISQKELDNYKYLCAGLLMEDKGQPYVLILDVKPLKTKSFVLKEVENIYEEHSSHNVDKIPLLIKFLDKKIKEFSGFDIIGMYDLKLAMILQKLTQVLGLDLIFNIAVRGEPGTGKTFLLKLYGMILYNGSYKQTNGNNVSIPSLRGSTSNHIMITKGSRHRLGLLTLFNNIYIDEINMNPDLLANLRPLLLETQFSNDKADGNRITYTKTAQVNIAENVIPMHQAEYNKKVKEEYKSIQDNTNNAEFEKWSEEWNLQQPLYTYDNKVLMMCIKNVRQLFLHKDKHWLHGCAMPDYERFAYNIYLKNSDSEELEKRSLATMTDAIRVKGPDFDIKELLKVDNIDELFESFKEFNEIVESELLQAQKVIKKIIVEEFRQDYTNDRLKSTAMKLVNFSRMLNKRYSYNDIDFNHLRRFMYVHSKALFIDELNNFDVPEIPSWDEEEDEVLLKNVFGGLPEGEFE